MGQEAVAAGVSAALEKEDLVVSNHRGHGHSLARGVLEEAILSELMGKDAGMCLGLGGSMHSTDLEAGVVFSTAIVGGGIPLSAGIALALKLDHRPNCVVCFFGDGATNTGAFHEGVNLAAVWKLPVVFICENNQYAVSVPVSRSTLASLQQRGQSYGIPAQSLDGMNVLDVYAATSVAASRAKKGEGPTFLECRTYRYTGHGAYDTGLDYRTQQEIDEWKARDPIRQFEQKLGAGKLATAEELDDIRAEIGMKIQRAVEFAQDRPYPPVDILTRFVWAQEVIAG
jgi:TPP-dependent pyruvate/acetoin dehydrogenase alpha subunit